MSHFFNSVGQVAKNYGKYDEWEQRQADERAKKEYLAVNTDIPQDKLDLVKKKAETVVRATEIMDAKSEDNCEDMEQLTGMIGMVPMTLAMLAEQPLIGLFQKGLNNFYTKKIEALIQSAGLNDATVMSAKTILKNKDREKFLKLDQLITLRDKSFKKGGIYGAATTIALILRIGIGTIL